jgi:hypothetical protein
MEAPQAATAAATTIKTAAAATKQLQQQLNETPFSQDVRLLSTYSKGLKL